MGLDLREVAVPTVNQQSCRVCARCAAVCPTHSLALENAKIRAARRSFMGCIGCGQCTMVCPTGSITVTGRRLEMGDLVDLPPESHQATADQLDALLLARRSVRVFVDQEVDRNLVDRILAMISTAPMGIPPSEVGIVVFHGRQKVRQFAADGVASFRRGLRLFRPPGVWLLRPMLGKTGYRVIREFVGPLLRRIVHRWDAGEDTFCYSAPLAMLFHADALADPADSYIAATYAMLAGQSLGLASCMLGTTAAFNHDRALKAKYGIPPGNKIGLGLLLGYPAVRFCRGLRRRLASVQFA